jgi:hypothetical protein
VNDDYLWDRSGEPDPEIQRLETLLGRYRYEVPVQAPLREKRPFRLVTLAAAAVLMVVAGGLLAVRFFWPAGEAWPVATVSGRPTIDGQAIGREARLEVGQELCTNGESRATVQIGRVGEFDVQPGSCVTLVATRARRHRLRLDQGEIAARVWAPPFTFSVTTPAGLASDIGCAFTLQYGGESGKVHVTSGWVDFDGEDRSALIPGGAITELRKDNPGTPYYADATQAFRAALHAYDFQRGPLTPIVDAARPRDAMTLLHLLERAPRADRAVLFDALVRLAPPPAAVSREGIIERDQRMIGVWRDALGLGGVKKWWLHWRDAL